MSKPPVHPIDTQQNSWQGLVEETMRRYRAPIAVTSSPRTTVTQAQIQREIHQLKVREAYIRDRANEEMRRRLAVHHRDMTMKGWFAGRVLEIPEGYSKDGFRCRVPLYGYNDVEDREFDFDIGYSGHRLRDEPIQWCQENCESSWKVGTTSILFHSKDDAVLFHIRFAGRKP